ncbi:hypothetical protein KAT08_02735 [Candidatus Babeliales bacterium]|nr:hypothetical protein [Candidatus Babeliales bacterium]
MIQKRILNKICALWEIKEEFRLKVFFLAFTFLLMSGCVSIWRPLKVSIFAKLVGPELVPIAKILGLSLIIPLIMLYSKLVDRLRRHYLLYCFNIFHGIGGIIFYFLLSHPVYGIANTDTNPNRLLGWFFYFFMESFCAFLSTSFWSFVNSINKPKDAKYSYGLFACGSKIGGIITGGTLYLILSTNQNIPDNILLPNSLLIGSLLLFGAATCVYFLMKKVPGYLMHGYEAVYQMEKKKTHEEKKKKGILNFLKESIEGLIIIIKNPYVLGIFSLVIFYEIIIVIFDFRVLIAANKICEKASTLTAYYCFYYFLMNSIGLVFAIFGTTPILRILGIRISLFIFPILSFGLLLITLLFPYASIFFWALVILRALNYALNHPTKEVLYIPTPKTIKFKSKAWIDAFGSRIAKGTGSVFNVALKGTAPAFAILSSITLSLGLASAWIIVVYFLGKTLQNAIKNKEVIGKKE